MTTAYDLYGSKNLSLESARGRVGEALGVFLEERDSSYQGGTYYMWGRSDSEHIILKENVDPFDGDPVEQSFPNYPVLLYINATERSSDIEKSIRQDGSFNLLRREVF
jgi:hypothetical protein